MFQPLTTQLLSLVFPVECVNCQKEGAWLCQDCLKPIPQSRAERCVICGKAARDGLCPRCRSATKLEGVVSLYSYKELPIQRLIKQAKYRGHHDIVHFLATLIKPALRQRLPNSIEAFAFVPMSPSALTKRGFNQSRLLGESCNVYQLPLLKLEKVRITENQAALDQKSRRANLRGAFKYHKTDAIPTEVAIFDDVITTGSTIKEIAKTLHRAGVQKVWAITVAHG